MSRGALFTTPTSNYFSLILYITIKNKDQLTLVRGNSIFTVNIIFKDYEIVATRTPDNLSTELLLQKQVNQKEATS